MIGLCIASGVLAGLVALAAHVSVNLFIANIEAKSAALGVPTLTVTEHGKEVKL